MMEPKQLIDLRLINPMTLAFVGDGVYEMLAREEVVRRFTSLSAAKLHRCTVEMVRASAQAAAYTVIEPVLTEAEILIFKRGRNASGVTPPRNSSAAEYRTATGLEALFGWLYLAGQSERISVLFQMILDVEPGEESRQNRKLDEAKDEIPDESGCATASVSEN